MVELAELNLIGAIIRQAIYDYKFGRFSKTRHVVLWNTGGKNAYQDSKDFLFTDRLKNFITYFGINRLINIESIRKYAKSNIRQNDFMVTVNYASLGSGRFHNKEKTAETAQFSAPDFGRQKKIQTILHKRKLSH